MVCVPLSIYLHTCLDICPPALPLYLFLHPSVYSCTDILIHQPIHLLTHLSTSPSICLSTHVSTIHIPIRLFIHPSIDPFFHLSLFSIHPSIRLSPHSSTPSQSICPFTYLFTYSFIFQSSSFLHMHTLTHLSVCLSMHSFLCHMKRVIWDAASFMLKVDLSGKIRTIFRKRGSWGFSLLFVDLSVSLEFERGQNFFIIYHLLIIYQ